MAWLDFCIAPNFMHNHGVRIMISNKGPNSKGKVESPAEEHTQRKTEPSTRELKRAMAKKAKRQKANE